MGNRGILHDDQKSSEDPCSPQLQTLDDTPTGGDPVQAARRLGGIVDSANIVETETCVCTLLHDHTFRAVPAVIE